ncbi:hypothetical protein D3C80_1914960 [compost metagenome]
MYFKRILLPVNAVDTDQIQPKVRDEQELLVRTENGRMRMRLLLAGYRSFAGMYSSTCQPHRISVSIYT